MPDAPGKAMTPGQRALAERYLPFARSLARPMRRAWPAEYQEFESAALAGLVDAALSFEAERGVKFATYARWRIRGALLEAQREKVRSTFAFGEGDLPWPVNPALPGNHLGFLLASRPEELPGIPLERRELLESWLGKLPARQAEVCRLIYFEGKTQGEAADAVGVSKSRVSYLHTEALDRMRQMADYRGLSFEECA
jgi:RNA polymerase sigma factor (sigma-70 family)